MNFLQTGIKMKDGETDAAFSLLADDGQWLVSAEDVVGVIPLGIKVVGRSKLWVVEFAPVDTPITPLAKVAEGVFELVPHVPGID